MTTIATNLTFGIILICDVDACITYQFAFDTHGFGVMNMSP